jgi:hypothetical protein
MTSPPGAITALEEKQRCHVANAPRVQQLPNFVCGFERDFEQCLVRKTK